MDAFGAVSGRSCRDGIYKKDLGGLTVPLFYLRRRQLRLSVACGWLRRNVFRIQGRALNSARGCEPGRVREREAPARPPLPFSIENKK